MTTVPIQKGQVIIENGIQYTFAPVQEDMQQIIQLHDECLPVKYDEDFYKSLSSGQFQTVIAHDTTTNAVIGIITGLKRTKAESDDSEGVLPVTWFDRGLLTYVLTLCVTGAYRKRGIAQRLFEFLHQLNLQDFECKALYLHVLATNDAAIRFYERNKFTRLKFLKNYYYFDDAEKDAYLYALYLHDGRPSRIQFSYPFHLFLISQIFNSITLKCAVTNLISSIYSKVLHMFSLFGEKRVDRLSNV